MSIIACRECGKTVSSEAKKCPGCGIKNPAGGTSFFTGFVVIVFLFFLSIVFYGKFSESPSHSAPSAIRSEKCNIGIEAEKVLKTMVYKTELNNSVIYVNDLWKNMEIDKKKSFANYWAQCFSGEGWVNILDSKTGVTLYKSD